MPRPKKIIFPSIALPETLVFIDNYSTRIEVSSEEFSTEPLTDDYNNYIGYRLESDISNHGTVAFKIYKDYVETVDDDSIDTCSLEMANETFYEIKMELPEAKY